MTPAMEMRKMENKNQSREMKFAIDSNGKTMLDGVTIRGVISSSIESTGKDLVQGKAVLTLRMLVDAGFRKDQNI